MNRCLSCGIEIGDFTHVAHYCGTSREFLDHEKGYCSKCCPYCNPLNDRQIDLSRKVLRLGKSSNIITEFTKGMFCFFFHGLFHGKYYVDVDIDEGWVANGRRCIKCGRTWVDMHLGI